ncbi:histone-lysine N-methyltransferase PRDM9-like [Lytechinus variegatus]|uniref:histone-lysine N-methyltransferase PRDM9-like n=1 Tax=Lytechinus variegatus TaxID=7654 RepID=UPI001BB17D45|nr:histone-lysine N-methyltransferase PRDM9-like [Lytechinus variegatus]
MFWHNSAPASSSTAHQASRSVPFQLDGIKSSGFSAGCVASITTPEDFVESDILPLTTQEHTPASNTTQLPGESDIASHTPKHTPSKEHQTQYQPSTHSPKTGASAPSSSTADPPVLVALNLKKSRAPSSSSDLPQGLSLRKTSQGKVEGVVTVESIEEGVEFGPYRGTLLEEDVGGMKDTTWEVFLSGKVCFYVDGSKTWMSLVRCALDKEEQNLEAYQIYGEIFYRSTKVIEPGGELKVFYSEDYMNHVGFPRRLSELHFDKDTQKFHCSQCEHLFASPKVILRHIKCEHTHSKPGSQSNEMIPVLSWRKKRKTNNSTKTEITTKLHSTTKSESNHNEQVFTCETCGKVFPTQGRLMAHKLFHEYNQEHACPVCGKGQGNTQALARHLTTHEPKLYKCKKCARQFKAETSLDKHMREVHGFRCQFCFELFTRKSKCLQHEQTHQAFRSGQPESNGTSPDETEPAQATTQEAKDMLGKTTTYYQKKRPYKCRFCPKRYTSCFSARDHEKENHTNEGSYKCVHCPKVFTSEHRLKNHLISHEQKGFYQCTLCPRSFGSEKALNNHQGEHTGLKPFKCEICGRGFRVKSHFHAHKRRMHQERPLRFFCSVCNKGFADKGNLVKHERRHKGIRPFVCLECGKGFTARTSLDTHVQIIHTKEKRFCCEVCGKKFSLNNHYTHHMIKHKMQGDADA